MSLVKELIEAGIHFGQRRSNWNPKMRPYIFATRNQIHIIDIKETIKQNNKNNMDIANFEKNVKMMIMTNIEDYFEKTAAAMKRYRSRPKDAIKPARIVSRPEVVAARCR